MGKRVAMVDRKDPGNDVDLRVLVADDEEMARKRATRLLGQLAGVEVVGQCVDGEQVLEVLETTDVDLLLLDIHMPRRTGLEVRALLEDGAPQVVFLTAHPQYALEAFEVGAVDYLLKPLELSRLQRAVDRIQQRLAPAELEPTLPWVGDVTAAPLPIESKGKIRLLRAADVTHASFDGQLVTVHTSEESMLCNWTLRELEARLPNPPFERVHRRVVLNLALVQELEPNGIGGYTAALKSGQRVEVARQAARRLRRRLGIR